MTAAGAASGGALGLLGGTFDPVHLGHLRFAREARRALALDAVALVPVHTPVHRPPPRASAPARRAMLEAAVAEFPDELHVDPRELAPDGPQRTIDTLASFRAEDRTRPLCLLLGSDQLRVLDTWVGWRELTDHAHLVVARRAPASPAEPLLPEDGEVSRFAASRWCDDPAVLTAEPQGRILVLDLPPLDLSSTAIRARCAASPDGDPGDGLVPPAVREYIRQEHLYTHDPTDPSTA